MHKKAFWTVALAIFAFFVAVSLPGAETVHSQAGRPQVTTEQLDKRRAIENELQSIAIVERKLMIPMRDGVKIATDVYRPKGTSKKYATIFVRTPYNFNYWDIRNSAPRDLSNELEAVKRGYAFVEMNERGRFFSEGNYDILGPRSRTASTSSTGSQNKPGPMVRWERSAARPPLNGSLRLRPRAIRLTRRLSRRASAQASVVLLLTLNRETGIAAVRSRCCSSHGSTASRTRCARCSRRTPRRKI